jgi:hypothetical protein
MDRLLREHLEMTYFAEYQVLRNELMELLTDDDLSYRPGATAFSLGELCREIGDIEHSYVEALRTFQQDFDWRNPDPLMGRSVGALREWYADLDRRLAIALEALTEDEVTNRRVTRHDFDVEEFSPGPRQELDVYREALLIFYGKVSIYLRAMDKTLSGHWQAWIG